ncbi:MAG: recombinase XerD [Betaproteobacteria bacterium RIFCSPLOWO2_02_FULL_67_26]|nr:MAG: recombinase XerD [Betaproteobacteria bacterium RIFCSPLOWO2_02_FULL_67_26]
MPAPGNALHGYAREFREWTLAKAYSERTVRTQHGAITRFIVWADERGLAKPSEVTRPILERYQRHLYHYRKKNGQPLSVGGQLVQLHALKAWFKWLTRENHILSNPASELELPRLPRLLPRGVLSVAQIEEVINQCDVATPLGLRNRAMFETFYSTGIRKFELINLKLYDVDLERGTVMVRAGKGARDRIVPVGERACAWIDKYLRDVRPELVTGRDDATLFLHEHGCAFPVTSLGDLVKRHLEHAGIQVRGACHLFRHAMATHMLENGADTRFIQMMLGHADLATTQIYTRVSIAKLKEIHIATHPARLERAPRDAGNVAGPQPAAAKARDTLLAALNAERDEDAATDAP